MQAYNKVNVDGHHGGSIKRTNEPVNWSSANPDSLRVMLQRNVDDPRNAFYHIRWRLKKKKIDNTIYTFSLLNGMQMSRYFFPANHKWTFESMTSEAVKQKQKKRAAPLFHS